MRTLNDKPDDPPRWDLFPHILSEITSLPLIVNGGVWNRNDIKAIR